MLGVSLALMEFMQVGLKITGSNASDLKFILPQWELDESDRPARGDCGCVTSLGAADTLHIRPVLME